MIDVILLTLDCDTYLKQCLDSVYREIPVHKIIAIDGGSKDNTLSILAQYPNMFVHVRPDIRTTGKAYEFALSQVTTPWVIFMDGDIELPQGWYKTMEQESNGCEFLTSKRIMHYEFYRPDLISPSVNRRPQGAPWLIKTDSLKNYRVDDDFMWRVTDILLRQVVERNGGKYKDTDKTFYYHHTTDKPMYESDAEKRGMRLVFSLPTVAKSNKENWKRQVDNLHKAIVKYTYPEYHYPPVDDGLLLRLSQLDQWWVKNTSREWFDAIAKYKKKRRLRHIAWIFKESTLLLGESIITDIKLYRQRLSQWTLNPD